MKRLSDLRIRKLSSDEDIPYLLLLLADETIESIDRYIHSSDIYILEQKRKIIAVYATMLIEPGVMEIKNIAVTDESQNKGLGYFLLMDAIGRAREADCTAIIICTPDIAQKQLYLYQKAGFVIQEVKKDYYIQQFPEPIFEDGIQLRNMVILKKDL